MPSNWNLAKLFLIELTKFAGAKPDLPRGKEGTMNTALVHHNKKTYALYEGQYPFGLEINRADDLDVGSRDFEDFGG